MASAKAAAGGPGWPGRACRRRGHARGEHVQDEGVLAHRPTHAPEENPAKGLGIHLKGQALAPLCPRGLADLSPPGPTASAVHPAASLPDPRLPAAGGAFLGTRSHLLTRDSAKFRQCTCWASSTPAFPFCSSKRSSPMAGSRGSATRRKCGWSCPCRGRSGGYWSSGRLRPSAPLSVTRCRPAKWPLTCAPGQ